MATIRKSLLLLLVALVASGCTPKARSARHLSRGENYLKSGDAESAKIEFIKALRADGTNVQAYERIGEIWSDQGAPLRALPYLVKVRDLTPDDVASRAKLAQAFLSLAAIPDARKEALAVLAKAPANGDALLILAECPYTPEWGKETEEQLAKFPAKDDVNFLLASANVAIQKGDKAAAQAALTKALQIAPQSPLAHLGQANLANLQGDAAQALAEFKKAAELAPLRSQVRLQVAEYQAGTGALPEARAGLEELRKKAPDYFPAATMLARFATSEKKYDEALGILGQVLAKDGANVDALFMQAETWLAKGDLDKAIDGFQHLNSDFPRLPFLKVKFARALQAKGNTEAATKALDEAIALNPQYVEAIVLLAELQIRAGQAQAAVESLTKVVEQHPEVANAPMLLASAYRNLGQIDKAVAVFRNQVERSPESPHSWFILGMVLREQQKPKEAREAFDKAQALVPNDLPTTYQLIEMDCNDGDFKSALQRAHDQIQKQPKSSSAQLLEGKAYLAQKNWEQAEAALQKALALDPNSAAASELLLTVYLATNRVPEAIDRSEKALAVRPNDYKTMGLLGVMYQKNGQLPKAQETYEKTIAGDPNNAVILNNLASLYQEQPQMLDKAADLAKRAQALQPADPNIADTYGWILYKKGDYAQAATQLQLSVKGAADPQAQYHLAMALSMTGQPQEAAKYFHAAAAATGDFPEKAEIPARLALVEGNGAGAAKNLSIEQLEAMTKKEPNDPLVWGLLGDAQAAAGAAKSAAEAYERALKINPKSASVTAKLAGLYAGPLHDAAHGLELARKARELASADPTVAGMAGHAALPSGSYSWAYGLLQEASTAAPADVAVRRDLALAAYGLGKVDEARKNMQQIVSSAGSSPEAQGAATFLALTAYDGNPQSLAELEPKAEAALKSDPTDAPALMVRAAAQAQHGDKAGAEATYKSIATRAPEFVPAQKALAFFYAGQPEKLGAAYDVTAKLRKSLPDDNDLTLLFAELSYQRKEYDYAEQLLKGSANKKPLDAKGLFYLGLAQWKNKEKEPSQETLKQALAAGLAEPQATEAKNALAELAKK